MLYYNNDLRQRTTPNRKGQLRMAFLNLSLLWAQRVLLLPNQQLIRPLIKAVAPCKKPMMTVSPDIIARTHQL